MYEWPILVWDCPAKGMVGPAKCRPARYRVGPASNKREKKLWGGWPSPAGYMHGPAGYMPGPARYMHGPAGYMVGGPAGYILGPAGYMVGGP